MIKVDREDSIAVECECGRVHIFMFGLKEDGAIDCQCGKHIEVHRV